MVILALIIGSLALVAASVSILLTAIERKRNRKQNAAYVETMRAVVQEHRKAMEEYIVHQTGTCEKRVADICREFESRLSDLEGGVIPDYEKAKAAAKAVNDFSAGISGILGFDPMTALQSSRKQEGEN